jgi:hypothetical protein
MSDTDPSTPPPLSRYPVSSLNSLSASPHISSVVFSSSNSGGRRAAPARSGHRLKSAALNSNSTVSRSLSVVSAVHQSSSSIAVSPLLLASSPSQPSLSSVSTPPRRPRQPNATSVSSNLFFRCGQV